MGVWNFALEKVTLCMDSLVISVYERTDVLNATSEEKSNVP